jgi:hypothetical protein
VTPIPFAFSGFDSIQYVTLNFGVEHYCVQLNKVGPFVYVVVDHQQQAASVKLRLRAMDLITSTSRTPEKLDDEGIFLLGGQSATSVSVSG